MASERRRRMLVGALFVVGLAAVVAVLPPLARQLSGGSTGEGIRGGASKAPAVQSIHGIEPLRTAFNGDAGRVRLYLLLSPT